MTLIIVTVFFFCLFSRFSGLFRSINDPVETYCRTSEGSCPDRNRNGWGFTTSSRSLRPAIKHCCHHTWSSRIRKELLGSFNQGTLTLVSGVGQVLPLDFNLLACNINSGKGSDARWISTEDSIHRWLLLNRRHRSGVGWRARVAIQTELVEIAEEKPGRWTLFVHHCGHAQLKGLRGYGSGRTGTFSRFCCVFGRSSG